jgi:hypothetical protein
MGSPGWGILGIGSPGVMVLGTGPVSEGMDTRMAMGLTYAIMIRLLNAKSLVMAGWTIGLYALSTPFTPTLTASAYTSFGQVPTFTGYAPQSLGPWSAAFLDAQSNVQVVAPLVVWTPGNTVSPGPVAGFYVLDSSGNLVGAQENPAGPITVGATLQPFSVFPIFREAPVP